MTTNLEDNLIKEKVSKNYFCDQKLTNQNIKPTINKTTSSPTLPFQFWLKTSLNVYFLKNKNLKLAPIIRNSSRTNSPNKDSHKASKNSIIKSYLFWYFFNSVEGTRIVLFFHVSEL